MAKVTVRQMTLPEYEDWQTQIAEAYAREQVEVGRWPQEGAVQRAREENARLLPDGPATARTLLLRGLDANGSPIGRAWVALDHPRGVAGVAFLYDIEVIESVRGKGFGRALLEAVEEAARHAGAIAMELNVFGPNSAAISLYSASGYDVVTQQMRKSFPPSS